jgi:hypothetical protein
MTLSYILLILDELVCLVGMLRGCICFWISDLKYLISSIFYFVTPLSFIFAKAAFHPVLQTLPTTDFTVFSFEPGLISKTNNIIQQLLR